MCPIKDMGIFNLIKYKRKEVNVMRKTTKRLVSFLTAAIMAVSMLPGVNAMLVLYAEYDNANDAIVVSDISTSGVDVQTITIEDEEGNIVAMEEYTGVEIASTQTLPVLETIAAGIYDVTVSCDGSISTCAVEVTPGVKALYDAEARTVTVINIPASEDHVTIKITGPAGDTATVVGMVEYDDNAATRVVPVLSLANGTYTAEVGVVESGANVVKSDTFTVTGSTVVPVPTATPTVAPTEAPTATPTAEPTAVDFLYKYTFDNSSLAQTSGSETLGDYKHATTTSSNNVTLGYEAGVGGADAGDYALKVSRTESGAKGFDLRPTSYTAVIGADATTITRSFQLYIPEMDTTNGTSVTFAFYANGNADATSVRASISLDNAGTWTAKAAAGATSGSTAGSGTAWTRADGEDAFGKWHTIAIEGTKATTSTSADGTFKMYIDGELVNTWTGLQINDFRGESRLSSHLSTNADGSAVEYIDNILAYEGSYVANPVEPTPTATPTVAPTATPTVAPTEAPTETPYDESKLEFYFPFDSYSDIEALVREDNLESYPAEIVASAGGRVNNAGYLGGGNKQDVMGTWGTVWQTDVFTVEIMVYTPDGNSVRVLPSDGGQAVTSNRVGVEFSANGTIGYVYEPISNDGTNVVESTGVTYDGDVWNKLAYTVDTANDKMYIYLNDTLIYTVSDRDFAQGVYGKDIRLTTSGYAYVDNYLGYMGEYGSAIDDGTTTPAPTETVAPTTAPTEAPTTTPLPTDTPLDESKLSFYFPFDSLEDATRLVDPAKLGDYPASIEASVAGRTSSVGKIKGGNANGGVGTWGQVWTDTTGSAYQVFTVEALIYNPNGGKVYIYPTNGLSATTNNRLGVQLQGDGTLEYLHNSWTGTDTGVDYNPNQWNKIAYTVNCNDQTLKIYLNGNLVYTYESDLIDDSGFGKDIRVTPDQYIYIDNFVGYAGEYGSANATEAPTEDPGATEDPDATPTPVPTPTPTPRPLPTQRPGGGSPVGGTPSAPRPTQRPAGNGGYVGILPTEAPKFNDMAGFEWAEPAVNALVYAGVVNGRTDTSFDPASPVTRAEFTKMVCGAMGLQAKNGAAQIFTDVPASHWAYGFIATAAELGIVNGVTDTEFMPNELITREQMSAILYRAIVACGFEAKLPDGTAIAFDDYDTISDYAKAPVNALSAAGVIKGVTDTIFAPTATANRAQAASLLYQYFQAIGTL